MADMADMLMTQAGQYLSRPSLQQEAIEKMSQLAVQQEQVQNQRRQIEQQKQELQQKKMENFGSAVSRIHEFSDPSARSGYVKFLKAQNKALNLGIPDDSIDFAFAGNENIQRVGTLQTMVETGAISGPDAMAVIANPAKFSEIVPQNKYSGVPFDANSLQGINVQDASDKIAKATAQHQNNMAMQQRASNQGMQVQTGKDEQAARAVAKINNDSILKTQTGQSLNIDKGMGLMSDPNHPPSVTTMNEIAQDFVTALSGKGISSDFKLKEINQKTMAGKMQELKAYVSSNPDQPAPPDVVAFWQHMGERLDMAYHRQIGARAKTLSQEAGTIYKSNPSAQQAVESQANTYVNGSWSPQGARYEVGGHLVPADVAVDFYRTHPQFKPSSYLKQELGL